MSLRERYARSRGARARLLGVLIARAGRGRAAGAAAGAARGGALQHAATTRRIRETLQAIDDERAAIEQGQGRQVGGRSSATRGRRRRSPPSWPRSPARAASRSRRARIARPSRTASATRSARPRSRCARSACSSSSSSWSRSSSRVTPCASRSSTSESAAASPTRTTSTWWSAPSIARQSQRGQRPARTAGAERRPARKAPKRRGGARTTMNPRLKRALDLARLRRLLPLRAARLRLPDVPLRPAEGSHRQRVQRAPDRSRRRCASKLDDLSSYWLSGIEAEGVRLVTPAPPPSDASQARPTKPKVMSIDEAHVRGLAAERC